MVDLALALLRLWLVALLRALMPEVPLRQEWSSSSNRLLFRFSLGSAMFLAQLIRDGRGWQRAGEPSVADPFSFAIAAAEATFEVTEAVVASRGNSDSRFELLLLLDAPATRFWL